jgi:flagella basal body P-ring formation protein FlgA
MKRVISGIQIIIFLAVYSWSAGIAAAAAPSGLQVNQACNTIPVTIKLNQSGLVKGTRVFLGDIADIMASGVLKEAIAEIDLGAAPGPGKIKYFDRRKIVSIIRSRRFVPDNIEIISPERVYIKCMGQTLTPARVKDFVGHCLAEELRGRDFEFLSFNVNGLEPYPVAKLEIQPASGRIVRNKGRISSFLDIIVDGRKQDRLNISGRIAVYADLACASRIIEKGSIVSGADMYLERRNIFEINDGFVTDPAAVVGKIATRRIRKGQYINPEFFSEPPVIRKGDIVDLIVKNPGLLIVTRARSREDGYADKMIMVENLSSGKLVRGIVKGRSKVEVVY